MPILAILEYSLYLLLGMWNKFFQCLFNSVSDEKVFCLVAFFKRDLVKEMINIEFLPCNRIEDQTFFFGKEENWVPNCKTLGQLTTKGSKIEKDSF